MNSQEVNQYFENILEILKKRWLNYPIMNPVEYYNLITNHNAKLNCNSGIISHLSLMVDDYVIFDIYFYTDYVCTGLRCALDGKIFNSDLKYRLVFVNDKQTCIDTISPHSDYKKEIQLKYLDPARNVYYWKNTTLYKYILESIFQLKLIRDDHGKIISVVIPLIESNKKESKDEVESRNSIKKMVRKNIQL